MALEWQNVHHRGMNVEDVVRTRRALQRLVASGRAREIRTEAGLSLHEVAAAVGVAAATVWRWEAGQRTPRGAAAARYLALLRQLREVVVDG